MLRAITFHGKREFTAEYYANEVKNRSYMGQQLDGYYKGYGNNLNHAVIADTTFRINSGLFLVQGRQCCVVLNTAEDIIVPTQSQSLKGYIIARIDTNVVIGDNLTLTYKLGTSSEFPSLTQEDTLNIAETESAIYELPLYSFEIYTSITNVTRIIEPIKNAQIQIDTSNSGVSDYLFKDALYIKIVEEVNGVKYYNLFKNDANLSKIALNDLRYKADLINGRLPVEQLPETGISADYARALTYGQGTLDATTIMTAINNNTTELMDVEKIVVRGTFNSNNYTVNLTNINLETLIRSYNHKAMLLLEDTYRIYQSHPVDTVKFYFKNYSERIDDYGGASEETFYTVIYESSLYTVKLTCGDYTSPTISLLDREIIDEINTKQNKLYKHFVHAYFVINISSSSRWYVNFYTEILNTSDTRINSFSGLFSAVSSDLALLVNGAVHKTTGSQQAYYFIDYITYESGLIMIYISNYQTSTVPSTGVCPQESQGATSLNVSDVSITDVVSPK